MEITESSQAISQSFFSSLPGRDSVFLFGNEGGGLSVKQRSVCEYMVHIPQFSAGGMASINVACASAIVLYMFASWAGYTEGTIRGEKFV